MINGKLQFTNEMGMELAKKHGNILFLETSALNNTNVEKMFDQCVRLWMHAKLWGSGFYDIKKKGQYQRCILL